MKTYRAVLLLNNIVIGEFTDTNDGDIIDFEIKVTRNPILMSECDMIKIYCNGRRKYITATLDYILNKSKSPLLNELNTFMASVVKDGEIIRSYKEKTKMDFSKWAYTRAIQVLRPNGEYIQFSINKKATH